MHGPITIVSWAQKSNYSGSLNNTCLNCVGSLICSSFSINTINVFSLEFLNNSSLSLAYYMNIVYNTIDPWTTLVWTVRLHLTWIFSNWPLFNSPLQFKSMLFSLVCSKVNSNVGNPCIQRADCSYTWTFHCKGGQCPCVIQGSTNCTYDIQNMCVNPLFMLTIFPLNSRLLAIKFWGESKVICGFFYCVGVTPQSELLRINCKKK